MNKINFDIWLCFILKMSVKFFVFSFIRGVRTAFSFWYKY